MSMAPLPSASPAVQALSCVQPGWFSHNAMFTMTISSLTATSPSRVQSPTHCRGVCVEVGLGVSVPVAVALAVGVEVAVWVAVMVGAWVGVMLGGTVGVLVGVTVGVLVGVRVVVGGRVGEEPNVGLEHGPGVRSQQ